MPLTFMNVGDKCTIKKISGQDETKKFLESLGFVIGSTVTVISQIGGSMILNIKDARIALGKDMTKRIIV